jgi:hypothetical protein
MNKGVCLAQAPAQEESVSRHFYHGESKRTEPSIEAKTRALGLLFSALGLMFAFGLWAIPGY